MPSIWLAWLNSLIQCIEFSLHLDLKPPFLRKRWQLTFQ